MKVLVSLVMMISVAWTTFGQKAYEINRNRRYDEISWLITHNAYNNRVDGPGGFCLGGGNQERSILRQLQDGVRSFMVDMYRVNGKYRLKHGSPNTCMMNAENFNRILYNWIKDHPLDIITLHIEAGDNFNRPDLENVFLGRQSGYRNLSSYIYNHKQFRSASRPNGSGSDVYPTINEMLAQKKQLVIYVEKDVQSDLFQYEFSNTVQNLFRANQVDQLFNNDKFVRHRGVDHKTILTVNHFAVDSPFGTGDKNKSRSANQSVLQKAITAWWQFGRKPSVAVDYYEMSRGRSAMSQIVDVNAINEVRGKFILPSSPGKHIRDVKAYFAAFENGRWQKIKDINHQGQRSNWHLFYSIPAQQNETRAVFFEHPSYTFSPAFIELEKYRGNQRKTSVVNVTVRPKPGSKSLNTFDEPLAINRTELQPAEVLNPTSTAVYEYTLYSLSGRLHQKYFSSTPLRKAIIDWKQSGKYQGLHIVIEKDVQTGKTNAHKIVL